METMKNEAPHSDFRERAVRYLAGEMGSDERHLFEQEMAGNEEKQRIFREYTSIWTGVDQLSARSRYDLDREWEQFSGKIDLDEKPDQRTGKTDFDSNRNQRSGETDLESNRNQRSGETDFDRNRNQRTGKIDLGGEHHSTEKTGDEKKRTQSPGTSDLKAPVVRTLPRRVFAWRAAAVIVAGLAGLAGWLVLRDNISYEQLAVQQGTEVVELADGSTITLNAGSTLKYDVDEISGERNVKLRGEAFFEIARDPDRPFIIDAGAAVVQVLGTSFNVRAYEDNAVVEVTVSTGLVSMAAKSKMDQMILLNPGNAGIYDKNAKNLELISSADPNAAAWKTRKIVFDETPLDEVVKVISHVYQSEIELADVSLAHCPITVSFHDQELGAVLSVITNTLDLQMERRGGAVVLSGEGCD